MIFEDFGDAAVLSSLNPEEIELCLSETHIGHTETMYAIPSGEPESADHDTYLGMIEIHLDIEVDEDSAGIKEVDEIVTSAKF